jgi:hypothetical protein
VDRGHVVKRLPRPWAIVDEHQPLAIRQARRAFRIKNYRVTKCGRLGSRDELDLLQQLRKECAVFVTRDEGPARLSAR